MMIILKRSSESGDLDTSPLPQIGLDLSKKETTIMVGILETE